MTCHRARATSGNGRGALCCQECAAKSGGRAADSRRGGRCGWRRLRRRGREGVWAALGRAPATRPAAAGTAYREERICAALHRSDRLGAGLGTRSSVCSSICRDRERRQICDAGAHVRCAARSRTASGETADYGLGRISIQRAGVANAGRSRRSRVSLGRNGARRDLPADPEVRAALQRHPRRRRLGFDASRGVRLWHRTPAAYVRYLTRGRSTGFPGAWQQVPSDHRTIVDRLLPRPGCWVRRLAVHRKQERSRSRATG